MKIAFLSFYNGLVERGAETWTAQLCWRLKNLGHDVTIIQASSVPIKVDIKRHVPKDSWSKKLFLDYWSLAIFKFTWTAIPMLWNEKYEIMIPINGGWQSLIVRLLTWVMGAKMLIVGHSGRGRDDILNAWCFPDRFVALSNVAKRWTKTVNPFIKVEQIGVGVDLNKFSPSGKKIKLSLASPVILVVAALEQNKQIDLTIKAVAKLPQASLLILGQGEQQKMLNELGNKLLPGRFLLTQAPFAKIPQYYRCAQVFTLGSWQRESSPAVYLEAMASGLPVVATDDPIRREIVGDAGLFVDPSRTDDYAEALNQALKTDWGQIPRLQAEKSSWDQIAQQYHQLLMKL